MDKYFAAFTEKFGFPINRTKAPASTIGYYRGRLPEKLVEYWSEHGWGGYGESIFWLVDPQQYEPVVTSWLDGTQLAEYDNYHLIARSAFGDLHLWGERSGFSLEITSISSHYTFYKTDFSASQLDNHLQGFILSKEVEWNDFNDLFKPALKELGQLNHDEMYGFSLPSCWAAQINSSSWRKSAP